MKNRKHRNNPLSKLTPPPYITIEGMGDVDIEQMYWPVDTDDLMGQGITGKVHRPYSIAEIIAALPPEFRSDVTKSLKEGFSPVLFVDLLSGATAIEMRKYTPPSPSALRRMRQGKGDIPASMFFKKLSEERGTASICPLDAQKLREGGKGTSSRTKAPSQRSATAKRRSPHRVETRTYAVTKP